MKKFVDVWVQGKGAVELVSVNGGYANMRIGDSDIRVLDYRRGVVAAAKSAAKTGNPNNAISALNQPAEAVIEGSTIILRDTDKQTSATLWMGVKRGGFRGYGVFWKITGRARGFMARSFAVLY